MLGVGHSIEQGWLDVENVQFGPALLCQAGGKGQGRPAIRREVNRGKDAAEWEHDYIAGTGRATCRLPPLSTPAVERLDIVRPLERRRVSRALQAQAPADLRQAARLVPIEPLLESAAHGGHVSRAVAQ